MRTVPRDTVLAVPAVGALRMPDRFVVRGSECVLAGTDTLRRGVDYSLDSSAGLLQIFRPIPLGRVRVLYEAVPAPLAAQYGREAAPAGTFLPSPVASADTSGGASSGNIAPRVPSAGGIAPAPARGSLDVRGSKTVAVDIGSNRDATLRQSLDLSLSGTVAPGVTLAGALSDQSIPLTAEGASASLSELDRVWLTLTTARSELLFGDYDLQTDAAAGAYLAASRRLNGARLAWHDRGAQVTAQIAQSRGRWDSREFFGQDGVQGPYALLGAGVSATDVVPGSERVFLDGVPLQRGEAADYVVDDGRGTITFSTRHPISARSRITLEVQVGQHDLSRTFRDVRARQAWRGATSEIAWMREADGAGVTASLTDAERAALRSAGDSATASLLAVRAVGAGKGDYTLVPADSLSPVRYRYAGAQRGDYSVDFLFVGAGRGDYAVVSDSTAVHYEYTGPLGGSYVVGRRVPAPSATDVLGWTVRDLRVGALRGAFEGALSRNDRNTLSPVGDGDNWGGAGTLTLGLAAAPLHLGGRRLGVVDLHVEGRDHGARFRGLSRTDDAASTARWNIAPGATDAGARSGVVRGAWRAGRAFGADGSFSALRLAGGGDVDIWTAGVGGGDASAGAIVWRAARERSVQRLAPGDSLVRRRDTVTLDGVRGRVQPLLRLTNEERSGRTRDGLVDVEAGVSVRGGAREAARLQLSALSRDDRSAGAGAGGVHARGVRGSGRAGGGRASISAEGETWWRRRGAPAPASLARLTFDAAPLGGALHASLAGTLTARVLAGDSRDVFFVGAGLGRYDSLGVYVGRGDFDVRVRASGDTLRATQTALSWTCAADGARAGVHALRAVRLSQLVTVRAVSEAGVAALPWIASPVRWADDAATASGDVVVRHEADWTPSGGAVHLRQERTAVRETPYRNERRTRHASDWSARVRGDDARRGSLETEWTHRTHWSDAEIGGSAAASYRVLEDEWRVTLSPRRGGPARLDLSAGGLAQRDALSGATRHRLSLRPEASWTPWPTTRLDLRAAWVRERRSGSVQLGVGVTAGLGEPTNELHATIDHRLGERVTGTLGWDVQRFGPGSTVQTGRAEVRASL